jgi:hypothetical protein
VHRVRLRESGTVSDAPEDEEALRWEGDDALGAPARPRTPTAVAEQDVDRRPASGGSAGLVAIGVLGGVFLLETLGWLQSVNGEVLRSTISPGSGTPLELAAFGINVLGRVAAVLAPVLWFGIAVWRLRVTTLCVGWLVAGALILLPWPALLHLA